MFQKIYVGIRMQLCVEQRPNRLATDIGYWDEAEKSDLGNCNSMESALVAPTLEHSLEALAQRVKTPAFTKVPGPSHVYHQSSDLINDHIKDLSAHVERIYSWAQDIRKRPFREIPLAGTGQGIIDDRILIPLPERLPRFTYIDSVLYYDFGEHGNHITHYLEVADGKIEWCLECAPGLMGTKCDGDKLFVKASRPNEFVAQMNEGIANYLAMYKLSPRKCQRKQQDMARFVLDVFAHEFAGYDLKCK